MFARPAQAAPRNSLAIITVALSLLCGVASLWAMGSSAFAVWVASPMGTALLRYPLVVLPVTAVGMLIAAALFIQGAVRLLRRRISGPALIVAGTVLTVALSAISSYMFSGTMATASLVSSLGLPALTAICALLPGTRRWCLA
ncbi:hypothetical protein [Mycolicibacterium neworleansense]|uniref:Uncharacterized protein n=1 Tax=Mycolicibacterium neworleansense TaxID=146018 RepID=A0A0H5RYI0_9MYCO|nr:hypothetical protein [Mycolicibacterium neworleansense]MCV7362783.1 hypothetical protein [Mycolicibacterium neworleansense]CRZ18577.1 hypothetical protein BN2156_05481 [Mycolicibacterium neworleansense]